MLGEGRIRTRSKTPETQNNWVFRKSKSEETFVDELGSFCLPSSALPLHAHGSDMQMCATQLDLQYAGTGHARSADWHCMQ